MTIDALADRARRDSPPTPGEPLAALRLRAAHSIHDLTDVELGDLHDSLQRQLDAVARLLSVRRAQVLGAYAGEPPFEHEEWAR